MRIKVLDNSGSLAREEVAEALNSDGIELVDIDFIESRFDASQVVDIVVNISGAVALGMLSNWLYDLITTRRSKVSVNRKEITVIDRDSIQHIVEEQIRFEE